MHMQYAFSDVDWLRQCWRAVGRAASTECDRRLAGRDHEGSLTDEQHLAVVGSKILRVVQRQSWTIDVVGHVQRVIPVKLQRYSKT